MSSQMSPFQLIGYDSEIAALTARGEDVDFFTSAVIDVENPLMAAALDALPNNAMHRLLVARFGLGTWSLSRWEVAEMLGTSLETVSLLERQGIAYLQRVFRDAKLEEAA
jgi:hypothetical protein